MPKRKSPIELIKNHEIGLERNLSSDRQENSNDLSPKAVSYVYSIADRDKILV